MGISKSRTLTKREFNNGDCEVFWNDDKKDENGKGAEVHIEKVHGVYNVSGVFWLKEGVRHWTPPAYHRTIAEARKDARARVK